MGLIEQILDDTLITPDPESRAIRDRLFKALMDDAYQREGARAFESPREHAALHEAGHAVISQTENIAVKHVRVDDRWIAGIQCWNGFTASNHQVETSPHTTIEQDFLSARMMIAGVVAEQCFLPDFRAGSSLNEVVFGHMIVKNMAAKVRGGDEEQILLMIVNSVATDLQGNERTLRAIAAALMHARIVRGAPLRKLLANVRRVSPAPPKSEES
jgi:hypothetical protein